MRVEFVNSKITSRRINSYSRDNLTAKHNQLSFTSAMYKENIKTVDKVINSLSKKDHIIALFMDLSKAFDTIDHDILLHKLYNYGIRGIVWSWIKSYLSNHQQYVSIDDVNSPISHINCGVPQGFIL